MKIIKQLSKNNSAVSPIIGEILMVAIVVIIGAIIASYAFGLTGGPLQDTYLVATSVDKINADNIVVTFMGGIDADLVYYLNVSVNGNHSDGDDGDDGWSPTEGNTFDGDGLNPIKVGETRLLKNGASGPITSSKDHVIIVAGFADGTKQIVLDTKI